MNKVSVAMTTYCGEQYVVEQLQSVLFQTRKPDEVIICDDCSHDSTAFLVQEFIRVHALENWKLYINEENKGYVSNFKKAMELTTGDVVFLCDQDDVWCPEKIQRMMESMEKDQKILALASNYRLIGKNGERLESNIKQVYKKAEKADAVFPERVKRGRVLYSNVAQGCTCAYRREVLREYCNTASSILPHDWAANMLAYRNKGLYFLNCELINYRIHENNTVGLPQSRQRIRDRMARLVKYRDCICDAKYLPLSVCELRNLKKIADFTSIRIDWLENRSIGVWLRGVIVCFPVFARYFLLSYLKDFIIGLRGDSFNS